MANNEQESGPTTTTIVPNPSTEYGGGEESGPDHEKEPSKLLLRWSKSGKNFVDKPWIIDFIGKEVSVTMANDDLEYGRVLNEEELLGLAKSGKNCVDICPHEKIRMVPSVLRKLSKKSFIPRVVSIGPLHRDNKNLHEFERMKASYLRDLLSRRSCFQSPEDQLKECLEKVKAKIEDIKSAYDEVIIKEKYKDNAELVNMMVLDGSFILEFCLKRDNKEPTLLSKIQITWIAIDLMLLENQIPFIVLQTIFDCTINNRPHPKNYLTCLLRRILGRYIHPFSIPDKEDTDDKCFSKWFSEWFSKMAGLNKNKSTDDPIDRIFPDNSKDSEHAHVLDCLHKIYKDKPSQKDGELQLAEKDGDSQTSLNYNHSVVELDRSGVNFKSQKKREDSISMKIKPSRSCFLSPWSRLTLFMPTLVIQEFTEAVLRNFIAYEQFSPQVNYYFTSYASVMDMLIDSKADVGKLVESKVIVNNLGSNKDVATVINGICVNIEIERFCYSEEIQKLDEYYKSYWPKHFAYLKRTYFANPWTVIAFFAGFILFSLAVLQAVLRIVDR